MLFMNELVNELLVDYGSIDKASADAVHVKVLAETAVDPKARDMASPIASSCFFMGTNSFGGEMEKEKLFLAGLTAGLALALGERGFRGGALYKIACHAIPIGFDGLFAILVRRSARIGAHRSDKLPGPIAKQETAA